RVHAVPRPVAARAGGAGRLVAEKGRRGPGAAGRGLDGSGLPPYARPMRLPTFSRSARIPLTGMAACLAAGLAAGPAAAAATWTIKPGGAVTLGLVTATIKDTTTANEITCKRGNLTGKLKSGSGLTGTSAGRITGGVIDGCAGPGPLPWHITLLGLPWHINLISYDGSTAVVRGTVSHMEISAAGSGCSFVIDGTGAGALDGGVRSPARTAPPGVKPRGGTWPSFPGPACSGWSPAGIGSACPPASPSPPRRSSPAHDRRPAGLPSRRTAAGGMGALASRQPIAVTQRHPA